MVVIIISGSPGSGKSTVARNLAKKFGLRHASAGDKMRRLAGNKDITEFREFHEKLKTDDDVDKKIDSMIKEEAEKGDVVIDGALAGYTVKKADIKIFLKLPEEVGAERISKRDNASKEEALIDIKTRWERNRARWKRIYGIDINDLNPYNIILDTSLWGIKEMNEVIEFIVMKIINHKGVQSS